MADDFTFVTYPHPHVERGRQIVAAHPEVRSLAGTLPATGNWIAALVALQVALSFALARAPWYAWLPVAFVVGATIDHALWVLIHDACHLLVYKWRTGNRLIVLLGNVPLVFPSAMSFWKYHLLHHGHLNDVEFDMDVPGRAESRVVGRSSVRKTMWIAAFALVVGAVRPRRMTTVPFLDRWTAINFVTQLIAIAAIVVAAGWHPLMYLVVSTLLAIGLHPLGARWIQEHYVFAPGQETYSYYGPLNRVAFNVGYHNEHHDIATIPWSRLPRLRAMAPEFYDHLYAHRSWTALLLAFIGDANITLFNRIVRRSGE
ncbi:MAG TPA: fatty acid desaturase [Vicinamibacterales bacterium]|jgi:sphingolipid delta-4 desaturase